jgi:CheY-like chemotaxis protein
VTECVAVDIDHLVRDVVAEVEPLLARLDVEIRERPAGRPVFASADETVLGRCLASIFVASAPGTWLGVTVAPGGRPSVVITAPRALPEQRPLTLEAVRLTIESLGGSVQTEMTDTAFSLRLELEHREAPAKARGAQSIAPGSSGLRVLIVDDEPLILETAKRLLARLDVTTTVSPRVALELVRNETFDVIVCDFSMPEMRGDAVFSSAVELGFDPKRFVLMTGGATGPIQEAFAGRAPPVLEKPYTRAQLEAAIRAAAS